jgi:hypothetical protein
MQLIAINNEKESETASPDAHAIIIWRIECNTRLADWPLRVGQDRLYSKHVEHVICHLNLHALPPSMRQAEASQEPHDFMHFLQQLPKINR